MSNNDKIRVAIIAEKNEDFFKWLISILNKEFIVRGLYVQSDSSNPPSLFTRWFMIIKKVKKLLEEFKPNKILLYGEELTSIWIVVFLIKLFKLKIEVMVFKYDIENFRPYFGGAKAKLGHFISKKLEKFCLLRADKIIHKGLENELEFLSFYNKIKNKPHYLFREFLNHKLVKAYNPKIKLSRNDDEIHTALVGSLPLVNFPYTDSIWEFYPKITNQKMHIHIYMNVNKEIENRFKKIEIENLFFHYHGYIDHERLIKEISKYDYGLFCTAWNRAKIKNFPYLITIFGNRVFDYITAHLPVIGSKDVTAVANLIDKYKVGFNIYQKDIYSLKEMLVKNKQNYLKTVKNISKAIAHFSSHKNFIKFIGS